jgi:hypothetical protein
MDRSTCTPVVIQGSHREIGQHFGELSKAAFPSFLEQSSTWKALQHWRGNELLLQIRDNVMFHFPWVWEELDGMADILGMDVQDLLLWNSRGDLLQSTQDGCTSVTSFSETKAGVFPTCGHNEDGDPFLYTKCHIVEVRPLDFPRFISFFYPGSIPGHSFGFNGCQIMHTVNNLRMKAKTSAASGIPRMVIARALVSCESLHAAAEMLRNTRPIGGFHYTLCKMLPPTPAPTPAPTTLNDLNPSATSGGADVTTAGTGVDVLSIEHTSDMLSIVHLNGGFTFVHTNHTIHDELISKMKSSATTSSDNVVVPVREIFKFTNHVDRLKDEKDIAGGTEVVTLSSLTRYQRANSIVASFPSIEKEGGPGPSCMDIFQKVLTDTADEEGNNCTLLRQRPDDPDDENTIVSVAFTILTSTSAAAASAADDASADGHVNGHAGSACQMSIFNFRDITACASGEPLIRLTL